MKFSKPIFSGLIMLLSILSHAQKFNNLAPTPPMGWNSWNYFNCNIDEEKIKGMADAMVSSGMRDVGYEYIVIDDCWQISRDDNGYIVADPKRFPSGIKALADYIHSKGLKFGIYSCAGRLTCQMRPGGYNNEIKDAEKYAEWGVDYLKYDWCNHTGIDEVQSYSAMRDALHKAGRPILFSLCEWGTTKPWLWAGEVGHMWRTTGDIFSNFNLSVVPIFHKQEKIRKYSGPDRWNDPDMLEVGNGSMSLIESQTHFAMWCMLSAPLIAGNDLRNMSKEINAILTNKEAIAIDQDALGVQALLWKKNGSVEYWFKPLSKDEYAICILNLGKGEKKASLDARASIEDKDFSKTYLIPQNYTLHDIFSGKDLGKNDKTYQFDLKAKESVLIRFRK